jgi:hypothetical protein
VLGRLLQLRSVIAAKDDAQRTARQLVDSAPEGTLIVKPSAASAVMGERGDLMAVG